MEAAVELESGEEALCYRMQAEKSTGGEVVLMAWSLSMDLLAAALSDHSVILNRLSWQRVWSISPTEAPVRALAWRPDGKALAVGRGDGSVCLYSVEDGCLLHTTALALPVSALHWLLPGAHKERCTRPQSSYTDFDNHNYSQIPKCPVVPLAQVLPHWRHFLLCHRLIPGLLSLSCTEAGPHVPRGWPARARVPVAAPNLLALFLLLATTHSRHGDTAMNRAKGRAHHPCDPKELKADPQLSSILLVGDEAGGVHICVSGVFLAASIDTGCHQGCCQTMATSLSCDARSLSVTVVTQDGCNFGLHLHSISSSLLAVRAAELCCLAHKFGDVTAILEYISSTLTSMQEAWEDVLIVMDSKLADYSKTLPEAGSVSDELLLLLACGRARPEFKTFLVDELTAKGVKKIGLSLDLSYSSIRNYIVNSISRATHNLQHHLGEALGMARWYDRFGVLGLSEPAIQDCISLLGTFALKTQELLHTIDGSLQSVKTFFLWLYTVILKLGGEPLPPGTSENLSSQELRMILDFLKKRMITKASRSGSQTFNLEVVGQYLSDKDLDYVEGRLGGVVERLMADSLPADSARPSWLFRSEPHKSLIQLFHALHTAFDSAFVLPLASMNESFSLRRSLELVSWRVDDVTTTKQTLRMCHALLGEFVHQGSYYIHFPISGDGKNIALLKYSHTTEHLESGVFCFSAVKAPIAGSTEESQPCRVLSLQAYSDEGLCVLLQRPGLGVGLGVGSGAGPEGGTCALAQLPVAALAALRLQSLPLSSLPGAFKELPSQDLGAALSQGLSLGHFEAASLAVSGPRRLAAVLSCSGKKIQLFDVEAEEEEEEEEGKEEEDKE